MWILNFFLYAFLNSPVFYKISFVTEKQNQKIICKSSTWLVTKSNTYSSNSTETKPIILYYLGFLRQNNGAWWTIAVTACLLVRLLFPQVLSKFVQNTHFAYLGMEKDKAGRPTIIFHSTADIFYSKSPHHSHPSRDSNNVPSLS